MILKFLAVFLFLFIFIKSDETKKENKELIVAVITNTAITVDDLHKNSPKTFELRFLKTAVVNNDTDEGFYRLENNSKISFKTVKTYRFDDTSEVLALIKSDLKADMLFVLHNENRGLILADGSEEVLVKLKLIAVDLNLNSAIDIIEEGKIIYLKDPKQRDKLINETNKSISEIILKKANGVFQQKINRRFSRENPFLPLGVLTFYDLDKTEFEKNHADIKKLIINNLKAPLESIDFLYNEKENAGYVKFNCLYEANDQMHLLRKGINEINLAFFNAYEIQYSIVKMTPVFKKSKNIKIIVESKVNDKCEKACLEILNKMKTTKMELDHYWLDNPNTQKIFKAEINFLKPSEFSTYGNIVIKKESVENLKKWLEPQLKELNLELKFSNEKCILLEAK